MFCNAKIAYSTFHPGIFPSCATRGFAAVFLPGTNTGCSSSIKRAAHGIRSPQLHTASGHLLQTSNSDRFYSIPNRATSSQPVGQSTPRKRVQCFGCEGSQAAFCSSSRGCSAVIRSTGSARRGSHLICSSFSKSSRLLHTERSCCRCIQKRRA